MAVGYRSSSVSGTSDTLTTSVSIPVPAGAQANDIALVAIEQWWDTATVPTVTPPAGFTSLFDYVSGTQKLRVWWKRLTGPDTGNYTFTWSGTQWAMGHCILMTGADTVGDPIDSHYHTANSNGTATPTTTVSGLTFEPGLVHFVCNENAGSATAPTNFTEVQDGSYLHTNYRIPGATGTFSATGGTLSVSTLQLAALIALAPASTDVNKAGTDTGTSTEGTSTLSTDIAPVDSAELATAVSIDASSDAADSATLSEIAEVDFGQTFIEGTDGATLSETLDALAVTLDATEDGTFSDVGDFEASYTQSDTGTLTDLASSPAVSVTATDGGTLSEAVEVLVTLGRSDTVTLAETPTVDSGLNLARLCIDLGVDTDDVDLAVASDDLELSAVVDELELVAEVDTWDLAVATCLEEA